jgi:hypothetical protein
VRALTKQARDLCKHLRTTPRVQPDHGPTHACGTSPHAWTRGIRIVPLGTCFPIHGWISPKTCTNCDIKAVERRQSKRMALYQRPQLYKFAPGATRETAARYLEDLCNAGLEEWRRVTVIGSTEYAATTSYRRPEHS